MASNIMQNVYYERKTGTAKACYVCRRPTQTVLATLKTEDFLYTCDSHLSDPGFATLIPAPPSGPTQDDIRKVVSEYHAREARKTVAAEASQKEGEEKKDAGSSFSLGGMLGFGKKADENKDKEDKEGKKSPDAKASASGASSPSPANAAAAGIPTAASAPTHKKYALHRTIYESRRLEHRRREQSARAKEVSQGLPQVPRGSF